MNTIFLFLPVFTPVLKGKTTSSFIVVKINSYYNVEDFICDVLSTKITFFIFSFLQRKSADKYLKGKFKYCVSNHKRKQKFKKENNILYVKQ